MAVSSSSLTQTETLLFLADLPLWLSRNALQFNNLSAEWSTARTWVTGGSGGGTNVTSAPFRPARLYDGRGTLISQPSDVSAQSEVNILFDLDENETIDAVAIVNHNFDSLSGTKTIQFSVADNNAFTTNLRDIASFSGVTFNDRLVQLDLSDSVLGDAGTGGEQKYRRFTSVQYAAIQITTTAGSFGASPQIGEIFIGRRRQMTHRPNPVDEERTDGRVETTELQSGEEIRTTRFTGRRRLDLEWLLTVAHPDGDGQALVNNLNADTDYFANEHYYVRNPSTLPRDCPIVVANPTKNLRFLDHNRFRWAPSLTERPPYVEKET